MAGRRLTEPRIQYAQTKDGVSIAYTTLGDGPPLVALPAVWEQFSLALQLPHWKNALESLGRGSRLILFDRPGFGLSQRDVTDFSTEANVKALEAVVDALALEEFALFAPMLAGPATITYAVQNPERVTHLILYGTFSNRADVMPEEQLAAFRNLARTDWSAAAQLFGDMTTREVSPEEGLAYGEGFRQSADGENVAKHLSTLVDVDELLPQLKCQTLVIHRREDALMPFSTGQKLAAGIPGAQFVPLEGKVHTWTTGDTTSVVNEVTSFLGRSVAADISSPRTSDAGPADTHTILFTDMEGSTTLADRLGDAAAQDVRRAHNEIVRAALSANGGKEIKHTGDGIMASFATASAALESAIAIQRGVAAHKEANPKSPLGVYVGLNAGEPIAEEDDLYGTSVNLAARICDHAEAGQIVASNVVRELAAGKDFLFADLGETELRGFEDPIKLWELRWEEQ